MVLLSPNNFAPQTVDDPQPAVAREHAESRRGIQGQQTWGAGQKEDVVLGSSIAAGGRWGGTMRCTKHNAVP